MAGPKRQKVAEDAIDDEICNPTPPTTRSPLLRLPAEVRMLIWACCRPSDLDLLVCDVEDTPHSRIHHLGTVTFPASAVLLLNRQTHAEGRYLVTQRIRMLYQSIGCMYYDLRNRTPQQCRFIHFITSHEISFAAIDDAEFRNAFPLHLARQWADVHILRRGERSLLPLRQGQDVGYQMCVIEWEIEVNQARFC